MSIMNINENDIFPITKEYGYGKKNYKKMLRT